MAWTEGVIKTLGNYHNSTATPLDGKTVVASNAELEDITAPYNGLIVHVAETSTGRKTYVCINAAGVPTSAPSGVIVDTVWKEVGGDPDAVTGPSSSTDNRIATFDAGTGKVIQDSGTLISDLATSGHNHTLNSLSVPTGDVSLNSKKITSLADPASGTDAANKWYVDNEVSFHTHAPANITTSGASTGDVLTWDGSAVDWAAPSGGGSSEWGETSTILHPAGSSGAQTVVVGGTTTSNSDIVLNADGSAVFNVQSAAVDFLIKGDTDAELFFVDGSADKIGIGTNLTNELVTIGGPVSFKEVSTPPSSTTDHAKLYAKAVSGNVKLFAKDSAGTEIELGAGGGGGLNFSAGTSAPSSPAVGDFWYETSANVLYMRIQDVDTPPNEVWLDISTVGGTSISSSGTAPSNPSLGDFWYDTTNNILYVRVEDSTPTAVWLDISTAGGGGSNWSSNIEAATLDGVVALKKQSSVPATTADYAKIYARGESSNTAQLLLHFNGNLNNSGTARIRAHAPGTYNAASFDSSNNKFGSHSLRLTKAGGDDFVVLPYDDCLRWRSAFTLDFWFKPSSVMEGLNYGFIIGSDRTGNEGINQHLPNTTSGHQGLRLAYHGTNGGNASAGKFYISMPVGDSSPPQDALYGYSIFDPNITSAAMTGSFHHIAICRDSDGIRFYFDGTSLSASASSNFNGGTTTAQAGETNYYECAVMIGTMQDEVSEGSSYKWDTQERTLSPAIDGWIDEFRVVKGRCLFTGSSFTVPSSAYGDGETHAYIRDSAGNETKLT